MPGNPFDGVPTRVRTDVPLGGLRLVCRGTTTAPVSSQVRLLGPIPSPVARAFAGASVGAGSSQGARPGGENGGGQVGGGSTPASVGQYAPGARAQGTPVVREAASTGQEGADGDCLSQGPPSAEVPPVGPGVLPVIPRVLVDSSGSSPMTVDGGFSSGRGYALLFPPGPHVVVAPRVAPSDDWVGFRVGASGLPPVLVVLLGTARAAALGGDWAETGRPPSMLVPDLVARVRRLPFMSPMDSTGRMLVDFHPPKGGGGAVGSPRGGDSRSVPLDPCWERELARVVAQPSSLRVEHQWVLSLPDDRHALLWRNRAGRASEGVLDPGFGSCNLDAPAFQPDVDYPTLARGIAASASPLGFGQLVPGTNRYPGLDYFPGGPPYLSLQTLFPHMAELKSASS